MAIKVVVKKTVIVQPQTLADKEKERDNLLAEIAELEKQKLGKAKSVVKKKKSISDDWRERVKNYLGGGYDYSDSGDEVERMDIISEKKFRVCILRIPNDEFMASIHMYGKLRTLCFEYVPYPNLTKALDLLIEGYNSIFAVW